VRKYGHGRLQGFTPLGLGVFERWFPAQSDTTGKTSARSGFCVAGEIRCAVAGETWRDHGPDFNYSGPKFASEEFHNSRST